VVDIVSPFSLEASFFCGGWVLFFRREKGLWSPYRLFFSCPSVVLLLRERILDGKVYRE
jgi:hypothetical protein